MASGKTTFGRALAEKTGRRFVDLDEETERREGMPVAEIIRQRGEEGFRKAESMALKSTGAMRGAVIACGGGTPCYRDNMEFMTLHGQTLWLVASPGRIAERIAEAGDTRPLVASIPREELPDFVTRHLLQRQPYYGRAQWRLSGEHLENEAEINDTVEVFMRLAQTAQTETQKK